MSLDLRHMLKVYNYINDEKKPKVNLKFLGLFAALIVAGGALVAFALTQDAGGPAPVSANQKKTDYVGLAPDESVLGGDALVQTRLQSWYADHPDANVERVEPVYEGGRMVGYRITYTEP
jgi:energy-converting hydrogenase Eha subunit F